MSTPPPEALDPRVRRFAREATAEMTCAQVADILGPPYSTRTVLRLCRNKQIECNAPVNANGGVNKQGIGIKMRWSITKAALLSFIIRSTHGPREALMKAIEQELPGWKSFAQYIASGGESSTAPLPANVIPMKGRGKATLNAAQLNDPRQLDLFAPRSA
ncbi:MAG: hypothetical protein K9N47_05660 [Prosthecobacter sp.]|uniref:hypothetical protein n=1 Tax=Prosthecobacter sp. TaxID=1965333 RepID=UPI0025F1D033|nr:hypothetical protein [Prosthecobacter sp.]MCF7785587.1 hypothetical protein [Prosthecobacter sp.]